MDFIVSCRTAVCGHSFCEECISESLLRKRDCPNCRKDIRKWVLRRSEEIDDAVKIVAKSRGINAEGIDESTRLNERIKNHKLWVEKHTV